MNAQLILPSIGIFLTVMTAATGLLFLVRSISQKRIRDRLEDVILVGDHDSSVESTILRDMELSTVPFLNELLKRSSWAQRLERLLVQGDIQIRLGTFISIMLASGAVTALVTATFLRRPMLALPLGAVAMLVPLIWAKQKKDRRVRQFERQFPDALDMLTSALRAGLALSGAVQVVANESPEPVSKEFTVLFEENRLGLDMKDALKKLGERVDSAELRLFVTAVILQRETGGNLAEILEGTAAVIRDRFRILGDVRSMTAQARFSGLVLILLPVVMAILISLMAPEYLKSMLADPWGPYMIGVAVALQIIGYIIMRRIVNIKV